MDLFAIGLFGSLILSLINILAASLGLGAAITWATGIELWPWIIIPLSFLAFFLLVASWLQAGMSGPLGMVIYGLNALLAPFTYMDWGLASTPALILALSPVPLYWAFVALGSLRIFESKS